MELLNCAHVDIVPDGDLVFIVGPAETRIRAHSLYVKTASSVMNAMLGPYFREGQQLREHVLTEVVLPDDNAAALTTILNIVHGRNSAVSHVLTAEQILQIAILSDKYDLGVSTVFARMCWFQSFSAPGPRTAWNLAMAALLFEERDLFSRLTAELVLNHGGSYTELAKLSEEQLDSMMPLKLAFMLEESRSKLRLSLIMEVLNGDWHCDANSKRGRHRPDWLTEFVRRANDFGNKPLGSVLEALSGKLTIDPFSEVRFYGAKSSDVLFKEIADDFRKKIMRQAGVCLWCVKKGGDHGTHV